MTVEYGLYVESGPRHRKTMVHVLDLLGCVANGLTTEEALAATPAAIDAYRRFLARAGESMDAAEPFETRVVQHLTEGVWLGNGSPYIVFEPDLLPVSPPEIELYLSRFHALTETLASWASEQTTAALSEAPPEGRTAHDILLHVLSSTGSYLGAALNGTTGFSRVGSAADRREVDLATALRTVDELAREHLRAATPEER